MQTWTFTVLWLVLLGALKSSASEAGANSCRLQSTSIRITRDRNDELGNLVRTCEGTVLVSRCEGTCISQVQPSITLPHGFLKVGTKLFTRLPLAQSQAVKA